MDAAKCLTVAETEPLSWEEICSRYPDQYVCMVDIIHPPLRSPEIISARVVGHGATDDEAFEPIRYLVAEYPRFAVRFTGESKYPLVRPTFIFDEEDLKLLHS